MSDTNPYLAPAANLTAAPDAAAAALASRGQRLGAVLLDTLIDMLLVGPAMLIWGVFDYAKRGQMLPFSQTFTLGVFGFFAFVLLHGYFLKRDGQTIGKKIVGIRIVNLDHAHPGLAKILVLRYLPISLAALIPLVGRYVSLVDVLFIYRPERRCLHDMIAGTKVVRCKKN